MDKRLSSTIYIVSGILIAVTGLGYFIPGSLNWGAHFLGFLPPGGLVLYLLLAAGIFILVRKGIIENWVFRLALYAERVPRSFFVRVGLIFIALAFLFRVKASLLGDSFTLIYAFRDYADGLFPLPPWHEPLSIRFLYHAVSLLGSLQYPAVAHSFFAIGVICGLGFILCSFLIVRELFETPLSRLMSFLLLVTLPYCELFFGYIEVYCFSQLVFLVCVLLSVKVLQQKMPFWILPGSLVVLTFCYYIDGLLFISMAYLAFLEYRRKNYRGIILGTGIAAVICLIVVASAGFIPERLINPAPFSHFLSLTTNLTTLEAYSQSYTLFSFYHFVDILNFLFLVCPFAVALIIFFASDEKEKVFLETPVQIWLTLAALPFAGFLFIAKLEQGISSDWDVLAGQFFLINLLAGYLYFRKEDSFRVRLFAIICSVTLLQSLVWFTVNAAREPAINRFKALSDRRILSHLGDYTHTLRLFRFYNEETDTSGQVTVWKNYILRHPDDPRGYKNQIEILRFYQPTEYSEAAQTYEQWIAVDTENDTLRHEYSGYCTDAGTYYYRLGKMDTAGFYFQRAVTFDTTSAKAFNNLGSVLAQKGRLDEAAGLFSRAVALDSTYADALYNLGNVYLDKGDRRKGMEYLRRSAELGNIRAKQQLGNAAVK